MVSRFALPALIFMYLPIAFAMGQQPVDFSHDVAPLLEKRCGACHTAGTYKGSVSFDTRELILESGTVVPGNAADSSLMERLTSDDPEMRMPLEAEPLPEAEIALIRRWIDEGLAWDAGFTFAKQDYVPPLRPRKVDLPPARDGVEHPIDRILARYCEEKEISLPTPAEDAAFLRRVTLDLIGLLPTPEEVHSFEADRSPQKHARAVDELLARDRQYAEHWLTYWNDLLRNDFQGTGYIDGGRKHITAWIFRSLMENKPYDVFVRELLHPSEESEGFILGIQWRGNVNASQTREVQFAQNTTQVFLGINMKCASCHDSFIDTWKLKDAYGLAAIVSETPLEISRCDTATGEMATAAFLYPELGSIDPGAPKKERLAQFAALMTHPDNGRFARTAVNRLWHRLVGRGIVHPVDVMNNRPWSEDLIDYLANYLVEHDYDLKAVLEHIATSHAYRATTVLLTAEPPQEGYVFAGPIAKRMTAEQFMDAIWRITGTGPTQAAMDFGDRGNEPVRAALVECDLLMRSLGRPNREQVVTTRPEDLTTLQALDLSNGQILNDLLSKGATNLLAGHPDWTARQWVDWVFEAALSRPATSEESEMALGLLGDSLTAEGLADLLWSVFMLPEFQIIR